LRCCRAITAVSADTETRCSSSSQRICSSVASGIIIDVNTRRNSDSGRAQPTLIICSNASDIALASGERSGLATA
jgi:hypothetical protein